MSGVKSDETGTSCGRELVRVVGVEVGLSGLDVGGRETGMRGLEVGTRGRDVGMSGLVLLLGRRLGWFCMCDIRAAEEQITGDEEDMVGDEEIW